MSNRRRRFQDALSDDINNFTQDAITHGVDEAIDYAIEDKVMDAVEGAARRKFGNHPALILLPEFIRAQRGYGPTIKENTSRQLRLDLGLEDEFPSIEEVEEALDDLDSSDLLDDIVDEWEQEIQDLVDEFEKEIDDLEETEDELPDTIEETKEREELSDDTDGTDEGDGEDNEEEEEPKENKKCWTISLGIGNAKVTFDTCEKEEQEEDEPSEDSFFDKDNIEYPPDFDQGEYYSWCPIVRRNQSVRVDWGIFESGVGDRETLSVGAYTPLAYIKYAPRVNSPLRDWIEGRFGADRRVWYGQYEVKMFATNSNPGKDGDQGGEPIASFATNSNELDESYGGWVFGHPVWKENATGLNGYWFKVTWEEIFYPPHSWPPPDTAGINGVDSSESIFLCLADPPDEEEDENKDEEVPNFTLEKKEEEMTDECCKATLSLTRKIYNVVGGKEESLYPYEVPIGDSDGTVEINNIKERIDILATEQQEATNNSTLLQQVANVTGTSLTPLYPEGEDEDEVANLAEDVRKNKDSESLAKIANVIGSSEAPLYPLEGEDINNLTEEIRNTLSKIAKVTGAISNQPGSYPGKLPKTMLGNESEQIDINSTPEMLTYLFKYLDSILGQYPIDTKIEDADASQEGDQPQTTEIPNISEALAELYGMIFTNAINIKDKRIEVDSVTELYFIKKNLFQMKYQIQAISDWLGFEPDSTKKGLKFSINPEERDYDKFLEPTQEEVEVVEFKENKNNKDLRYYLDKLLIAATTTQKAFGIPVEPGNIAGSILSFIKGLGSNPDEEWKQFKEDLEDGKFTDDNLGSGDNPKVSNPTLEDELDS